MRSSSSGGGGSANAAADAAEIDRLGAAATAAARIGDAVSRTSQKWIGGGDGGESGSASSAAAAASPISERTTFVDRTSPIQASVDRTTSKSASSDAARAAAQGVPGSRRQASSFFDYVGCAEENVQVRRLCGCLGKPAAEDCGVFGEGAIPAKAFTYHPVSERHLACALERLSRFSVVLVTELIGDAHFLLAAKLGWSDTHDGHAQRGGTSAESSALVEFASEPDTLALLTERHGLDMRLHAHAKRLMCRDLASLRHLTVTS